uniref:Hemerythrin n=1 Tax=Ophryotrocha globopalpata TaxID=864292 RepID=A0A286RT49_9ANNE|nr:hemerythrin [Ophryotrocha globopalpata]
MPGHAIPEPYKWNESFKTFYDQIDEEHRGLFDGIFACMNDNNDANLKSLKDKVTAHFTAEEGIMTKAKYADFDAHKALHTAFIAKMATLKAPLDAAAVEFAKDWLVQHIMDTDFKYKGKL